MSLLDTASLLLTPNAYKEGKLYSVIPSDGSGDFTFTRATTATRVNSDGLVELVPYNLVRYSEQFDNSAWIKSNVSVTANNTTAPDGTLTADLFNINTVYGYATQGSVRQNIGTFKASVYIKGVSGVSAIGSIVVGRAIGFTINSLGVVTVNNPVGYSPANNFLSEYVGNEWYRISFDWDFTAVGNDSFLITSSVSGTSFYLWGGQLVEGSTALPYQKTETRLNIPRLDYSNGTCPSILLEPQRTNLLQQSSSFDNVYWTKGGITLSTNNTTAPDNTLTADTLTENTANSFKYVGSGNSASSTLGTSYTSSVFAKSTNRVLQVTYNSAAFGSGQYANFDLQNGVVGSVVGGTAYIQDLGNGWYRCQFTATATATTASENQIYFSLQTSLTATRATAYTGDGTSGIYIWGSQLEAGAYATSYIPTTTASVTRNADICNKTGISSLIGQTEGTLYFELKDFVEKDTTCITIDDGTNNNRFLLSRQLSTGYYTLQVVISGVAYTTNSTISANDGKFAIAYNGSGFVVYRNGVQIITSTNAVPNNLSVIRLNGRATNDWYTLKKVYSTALWKTRLTNDQLAQLTTI